MASYRSYSITVVTFANNLSYTIDPLKFEDLICEYCEYLIFKLSFYNKII